MKRPRALRPIAIVMLVSHATACMTWKPILGSPSDYLATEKPGWIRVETKDGQRILLDNPFVTSDTLAGIVRPGANSEEPPGGEPIQIALADISLIEEHGPNVEGTAIAIILVGVLAVVGVNSAIDDGLYR